VQVLPVVVVRNASGHIPRLRRREKSEANPLHGKMVVWARGRVRREDNHAGQPVLASVARELEEELCLRVISNSLALFGAVYWTENTSTT